MVSSFGCVPLGVAHHFPSSLWWYLFLRPSKFFFINLCECNLKWNSTYYFIYFFLCPARYSTYYFIFFQYLLLLLILALSCLLGGRLFLFIVFSLLLSYWIGIAGEWKSEMDCFESVATDVFIITLYSTFDLWLLYYVAS